MTEPVDAPIDGAFGIDAFTLDDRLRLFHFAAAEKRHAYLWVLRAVDLGRADYQVLLHEGQVRARLATLAAGHPQAALEGEDVGVLLEALADWQVLDRSYDGTRAATLAEYRNRHYVYQFTQAGHRAFRAVEDVLGASTEDAALSRLVFPDILADLGALTEAVRSGDAEEVYRKLSRLDQALTDMAQRAARFYLMLGDLARTNDTRPEVFLSHKDALLAHMREFHSELARYAPVLAARTAEVDEVDGRGGTRLAELAAEADERLFRTPVEREADWRRRWGGVRQWFAARPAGGDGQADRCSEADRLQDATMTGIAAVTALLRRVTEARRGGVSRESQLRHLAQWFANCPTDEDAHTLYQAVFQLGGPRHAGVLYEDPEEIPARTSWWDAGPVELSRTLVRTGRTPAPRAPGRIQRDEAARAELRRRQLAETAERRTAVHRLAEHGLYAGELDESQTRALLALLDLALAARPPVPVSRRAGAPAGFAASGPLGGGSQHGVRLTLHPHTGTTSVRTVRGTLRLDGLRLEVTVA